MHVHRFMQFSIYLFYITLLNNFYPYVLAEYSCKISNLSYKSLSRLQQGATYMYTRMGTRIVNQFIENIEK